MPIKNKKIDAGVTSWEFVISSLKKELDKELSDLELSALTSWLEDCYESFIKIYTKHLQALRKAKNGKIDYDYQLEIVTEIFFELRHVRDHFNDAEKGFLSLMNALSKLSDEQDANGKTGKQKRL